MNKKIIYLITGLVLCVALIVIVAMFAFNKPNKINLDDKNKQKENNINDTNKEESKKITYKNTTDKVSIDFSTVEQNDPNTKAGDSITLREGKDGEKTILKLEKYEDDKLVDTKIISEYTSKSPVNKIILNGTHQGDITSKRNEVVTEQIPFKTITKEDPTIKQGTTITKTKGVNGKKEITYSIIYVNGKKTDKKIVNEKIVTEPIDEYILKGTYNNTPMSENNVFNTKEEAINWARKIISDKNSINYNKKYILEELKEIKKFSITFIN